MGVAETYADYWPAKCMNYLMLIHELKSNVSCEYFSEIWKEASRSSC